MLMLAMFLGGLVVILFALLCHTRMELGDCKERLRHALDAREISTQQCAAANKELTDLKRFCELYKGDAIAANKELTDLKCFIEEAKADREDMVKEITADALRMRAKLVQMVPAVLLCLLVGLAGCSSRGPAALDLVYVADVAQPVPMTDLPESMRITNWVGRDVDGSVGGSCVHASTINCFRSAGRYDLEEKWFQNRDRGYEGPEADFRILQKLDDQGILFAATDDGDAEVLEAASATGRMAVIFYYPSHSINFVEFNVINGEQVAVLLDNNFPEYYIVVPKDVFLDSWRNLYDGFAVVPWIEPNPSRTFPRTIPKRYLRNVYPQA
jgi:hypothetical protein